MKLRAKLLALLAPFVVLPMLALGWVAYDRLARTVEQNAVSRLSEQVATVDRRMRSRLAGDRANVVLLSALPEVERYLLIDDEETRYELLQPGLLRAFYTYQQAQQDYYEIRLLAPDGFEDTRAAVQGLLNHSEHEGDSAWFRDIRTASEDVQSRVVRNPDTGTHALVVSRRVRLRDPQANPSTAPRRIRGYVAITSALDFLVPRASGTADDGALLLTDGNGLVLIDRSDLAGAHAVPIEVVSAVPRAADTPTELKFKHAGSDFVMLGQRVHDNLYAFAALPQSQLTVEAHRLGRIVATITLITIVVISFLLYVALRHLLLDPMAALGEAARELGRGRRVVSTSLLRGDELGELARSFDAMRHDLEASNHQIRHMAYHDSLTGLPNRRLFMELLARAAEHAEREDLILALLFVDLDDFKHINDSLGHDAGDDLLMQLSQRLRGALFECELTAELAPDLGLTDDELPVDNVVARVGGDEFIVLLYDVDPQGEAKQLASLMMDELKRPFSVGGQEVRVSASIGITIFPDDGRDVDELVKNADLAMYHAKSVGKDTHHFFDESMNAAARHRMRTEAALRRALECGEFVLHYQPKVNARTGELAGVEALIRWQNPTLGTVPPGDFIPIAEETGLIVPIGEWALEEACQQLRRWQSVGLAIPSVAVNISNRQFARPGFETSVAESLARSGLPARCLELEITETCIMEPAEVAAATLARLKALGVMISMDDFGTGYSSLAALSDLPIDTLKIDRRFINAIDVERDDDPIISTVIAMGRSLGIEVVAEGVETEAQLGVLRQLGCDLVQGFLISRPQPADDLVRFVTSACGTDQVVRLSA